MKRSRESGASLLVVTAIIGIATAAVFGIVAWVGMQTRQERADKYRLTRDSLFNSIGLQARLPEALAASALMAGPASAGSPAAMAGNRALRMCLGLVPGQQCTNTGRFRAVGAANQRPFNLYVPFGDVSVPNPNLDFRPFGTTDWTANMRNLRRVTGTGQSPNTFPVRYSLSGVRDCTPVTPGVPPNPPDVPASSTCPFVAITSFWAECANEDAICDRAEQIRVRWRIASATTNAGVETRFPDGITLSPNPPENVWNMAGRTRIGSGPNDEAPRVLVSEILGESQQSCANGSYQAGFWGAEFGGIHRGKIRCKCFPRFRPATVSYDPITGRPNCNAPTDMRCANPDHTLIGRDRDGRPICRSVDAFECTLKGISAGTLTSCGSRGSRIRQILDPRNCRRRASNGEIICTGQQIQCCTPIRERAP